MNTKIGQQIIVNARGKSVYFYVPDGTSPTSRVPTALKSAWPAVTASTTPNVGTGLEVSKLSVRTQPDGSRQLAYNGHLLYTFAGDTGPGTANGQSLGGIWYVLSPAGNKIG